MSSHYDAARFIRISIDVDRELWAKVSAMCVSKHLKKVTIVNEALTRYVEEMMKP